MARPNKLTFLQPGKAIGAYRGFVDTFNWVVRFCQNLSGDGVTTKVDRLNDGDNPVVRCIVLGGGTASVSGYTTAGGSAATERRLVDVRWNHSSNGKLEGKWASVRYENGLLKIYVPDSGWTTIFETANHSAEPNPGSNDV